MNKLLMAMLALGLSACATYEQERITTAGEASDHEAGAVISEPRNQRYGHGRHHRGYGQGAVIIVPRGGREDDDEYEYEEHDD